MRNLTRITLLLAVLLSACTGQPPAPATQPSMHAKPAIVPYSPSQADMVDHSESQLEWISFADISGWQQGGHADALRAFKASCEKFRKKPDDTVIGEGDFAVFAADWKYVCRHALSATDAKAYFERYFTAYRIYPEGNNKGLLTGYYVPDIAGAHEKTAKYTIPVYARPAELVNGTPYLTRAEIERGALQGRNLEIAYVADPVDLFFMQVQGSGTLVTDNGERFGLAFAGKNNQPYVSIGKVVADRNLMDKSKINAFTLRSWLQAHPEQAREIMQQNTSYIFFKKAPMSAVKGAAGVALTPRASLAVDNEYMPYGVPVFVRVVNPAARFSRLMVTHDTGSAIKGALRGDIFFGSGAKAGMEAGNMKYPGEWVVLLPNEDFADVRQ